MNVNDRLTELSNTKSKPLEVSKAWVGLLPGEKCPNTDFDNGRAAIARLRAEIAKANCTMRGEGEPKPSKRRPSTGYANKPTWGSAA